MPTDSTVAARPTALKARYAKPCMRCDHIIEQGADIFPGGGEEGTRYSHYACAVKYCEQVGKPLVPPTCKHWRMRGYCSYGEKCFYSHPQHCVQELARAAAAKAGANAAARRAAGKRNKLKNDWRAAELRRFLIDTYGRELLGSGSGVLDVAGGHGALSFELVNLNSIPATVIDPRPLKTARYQRRLMGGIYHQSVLFAEHNRDRQLQDVLAGGYQEPAHVKMFLTRQMIEVLAQLQQLGPAGEGYEELLQQCCDLFVQSADKAAKMRWTQKGVVTDGHEQPATESAAGEGDESDAADDDNPFEASSGAGGFGVQGLDEDLSWLGLGPPQQQEGQQHQQRVQQQEQPTSASPPADASSMQQIIHTILNCSIIVGMHPDQATEFIIQLAMKLNKPFAIVPCCVYGNLFQQRRLKDGGKVMTLEQLIQYVCEKDEGRVRVRQLPFEGMNRVVWREV